MAAKTQVYYEYVAHVQVEDGKILEMNGCMVADDHAGVFQWLRRRAIQMNGHLVTQKISLSEQDAPWSETYPPATDSPQQRLFGVPLLPAPDAKPVPVAVPSIFTDGEVFGVYKDRYTGASLLRMKEKKV